MKLDIDISRVENNIFYLSINLDDEDIGEIRCKYKNDTVLIDTEGLNEILEPGTELSGQAVIMAKKSILDYVNDHMEDFCHDYSHK